MLIPVLEQAAYGLFFLTLRISQGKRVQATRNQKLLKILGLSSVLLYAAGHNLPVYAATSASDMAVTASVNASCTMSVASLVFGIYDPFVANAAQDLTASATVSTTCTLGATASVKMGTGLHQTSERDPRCRGGCPSISIRNMSNAGSDSKLKYEIYTNEGLTLVWNDSRVRSVVGTGTSDDLTVYGKVFRNQQAAAAGNYNDSVNVTVHF